jgi:hypothetical protein
MSDTYGLWATAIASAPLSSFWRQRMSALPTLVVTPARSGRWLGPVGLVLLGLPLALSQQPDPARRSAEAPVPRVGMPKAPPADEPAEKRAIRAALHSAYNLPDGTDLRLIEPASSNERANWLRVFQRGMESETVSHAGWKWDRMGIDQDFASTAIVPKQGRPVIDLVMQTLRVRRSEIEGPGIPVLDRNVWADVAMRAGTPRQQLIEPLARALREQLHLPVQLALKTDKREVWVARGKVKSDPLPGARDNIPVMIFGKEPPPPVQQDAHVTLGAMGAWDYLLDHMAVYVGRQVIADGPDVLPPRASVHFILRRDRSTDSGDENAVVTNVSVQTGLTFTREWRDVRILWVGRTD